MFDYKLYPKQKTQNLGLARIELFNLIESIGAGEIDGLHIIETSHGTVKSFRVYCADGLLFDIINDQSQHNFSYTFIADFPGFGPLNEAQVLKAVRVWKLNKHN